MNSPKRRFPGPGALVVLAVVACAGPPKDPVELLLQAIVEAAEERDATAVGACLSDDFTGEGAMTKADTVAAVRRYFAGYDRVEVVLAAVRRPEPARVALRVEFHGAPKDVGGLAALLPSAAVYEFELELTGPGAGVKVRRATWRPVTPTS